MIDVPIHDLVSIDETSVWFIQGSNYGYTPIGVPLHTGHRQARKVKKRVTLLVAISATRILHFRMYDGSCNSDTFADFITTLPDDTPRCLLMDNVSFHKTSQVADAMARRDFRAMYVPPYSPELNPIETVFSVLKRKLRGMVDVSSFITQADVTRCLQNIPEETLWNSFVHSLSFTGKLLEPTGT
jgi:transposase